jgi:peptidoglycan/xylan/chitin deacetylase (PgdA/CDA1 family)
MIRHRLNERALLAVLNTIPFGLLRTLGSAKVLIAYYHLISDEQVSHVEHLYPYKNIRQFESDLEFILKRYTPMDMHDLLEAHRNGRVLRANQFLLTFDDGFREMAEVVAPILLRKGVSATYFINSAFTDNVAMCYLNKASVLAEQFAVPVSPAVSNAAVKLLSRYDIRRRDPKAGVLAVDYGRRAVLDEIADCIGFDLTAYLNKAKPYLTSSQIRQLLADGFTIGGHSVDHPLYASLPIDEQLRQTVESVRFVRDSFGLNYGVFAFPHSDAGVSRAFFSRLADTGLVDMSFGTSGIVGDPIPTNVQRVSLERPCVPAKQALGFHHAKALKRGIVRQSMIARR